MNKNKIIEIFDEVVERYTTAESYCIQDFQSDEEDYSHEDLDKDIKEYRRLFQAALNKK